MKERFLILGASGLVGGYVLQTALAHGYDAVGASRERTGAHWVRFDLLDAATYAPALAGRTTVMLLSRPGDEQAHEHAAPFIAAMPEAGIGRVVVLSALGAGNRPEFSIRKVEELVEASGLAWTHVRPNFFAQTFARPPLSTEIARSGTFQLPLGKAKVAYVDARDVAAVLFKALTDRTLTGRAIELSGPEALTHDAVADRLARRLGKPVRFIDISEAQARRLLLERGFPAPQIERVLRFYALCRQGACACPDTEVAGLLGRPLGTLDEVIQANLDAWR